MSPGRGDALLVVGAQRDFLPGGASPVPGGDQVVPLLGRYLALFARQSLPRFVARAWHAPGRARCVAGTPGAAFAPGLVLPRETQLVTMAGAADRDAWSAFDGTDLHQRLQAQRVTRLFIAGLAFEHCGAGSARDALALGYRVVLLADAVRAVDIAPGDNARALADLAARGAGSASWTRLA